MIDKISKIDIKSKLDRNQARKILSELMSSSAQFVLFSSHCKLRMTQRNMLSTDVVNVLVAGKILVDAQLERGEWRYVVETMRMTVVIVFESPSFVRCVTAWRK